MLGKLYVVATPIGNLEDITLRAIKTLENVDLVYAEDTRVSSKLLSHYNISKPIRSYHQHSLLAKREEILNELLQGKQIALLTDAGTPGISDPGNELIDFLHSSLGADSGVDIGASIIPLPGASSVTVALSICGFNVNKFLFLGFLPKKKRKKLFDWAKEGEVSIAFFDSPKRLVKTLTDLKEHFGGDRRIFVARELTKVYEQSYRGTIDQIVGQLGGKGSAGIKGEVVIIIEGRNS